MPASKSPPKTGAPQEPPAEGFGAKQGFYVGIGGIAAAILIGIFSFWQAAEISKVSDVGADVRAITPRIDQTYSTLLGQANDIGSIKGDLRAATDKITAAADRSAELSNRLTSIVDKQAALVEKQAALVEKQDAQIASMQEIKGSVAKLVDAVASQQGELIKIEDKIGTPIRPFPQKKTELLGEGYVFSSAEHAKILASQQNELGIKGVATVDFGNPETFQKLGAAAGTDKSGDFKDMILVTKDAAMAHLLQQIIGGK
jgi:hypothetical protein